MHHVRRRVNDEFAVAILDRLDPCNVTGIDAATGAGINFTRAHLLCASTEAGICASTEAGIDAPTELGAPSRTARISPHLRPGRARSSSGVHSHAKPTHAI